MEMEVSFEKTINISIATLQSKIADIKSIHNPPASTSKFWTISEYQRQNREISNT